MLQLLYSASMYFKKAGLNKDAENPHLKEATALIDQAMDSGRKLIAGIRLPMIEDLGLYHSLREYVNGLFKNTGVKVYTEVNKKKIKKSEIDIVLYRIAQELLINVSKHSEAKNVNVKLFEYETELMLSVRDDGIGFKHDKIFFEEKAMSGHAGLQIAKEKCEMYSGQLLITSKPGFGTKVEVIMPKPFNRG
jgi:signal transduction histidine kinase